MNIVLITAGARWEMLKQSITSIINNAADWSKHELIVSIDCWTPDTQQLDWITGYCDRFIINRKLGASAARNIGAASVPKYRRQEYVCFFDDDVYCCSGWDAFNFKPDAVWSGHAHPFNHPYQVVDSSVPAEQTSVISTVHMIIPWAIWDDVGPFAEPGGPGGSEDVDWCKRAAAQGYTLGITMPQSVLHTGITSSSGKPIVGADLVMENNHKLEKIHGVEGKVIYT